MNKVPESITKSVVGTLWQRYREVTPQIQLLEAKLHERGAGTLVLDHFAMIDLPGPHTGISIMQELFSALNYSVQGHGYLPEKQNPFCWMAVRDCAYLPAHQVLPQAVVADFRLEALPIKIKKIVEKYVKYTSPAPITHIKQALLQNDSARVSHLFVEYFYQRAWPLPTVQEFQMVRAWNELLAWVLVFGRRPNHFTIAVHHLNDFDSLDDFIFFIEHTLQLPFNSAGDKIKGGRHVGISQGSTQGIHERIVLQDGAVNIPTGFIEFVWRYPHETQGEKALLWKDFYTGFIPEQANKVIESLYVKT